MGIGDFLKDVGDGLSSFADTVNKYTNPFYHEGPKSPLDMARTGEVTYGPGQAPGPIRAGTNLGIEQASAGLNWLYSNAISQPISTFLLVGKQSNTDPGAFFSADKWASAWRAAEHISPGQAGFLGGGIFNPSGTYTEGAEQAKKAIASPLQYYKPGEAMLPAGFDDLTFEEQQDALKQAGMPAVGNRYIEQLRAESALFKYASGTGDFALRWYADPTIIGGKVAGATRLKYLVKARPAAGWSAGDIDKILSNSSMVKAQQFIYANRDNPQLLNNLQMAKESAMGPRFGAVASLLKSEDEVNDFLRVGMGDVSAIERLSAKNALAADRLQRDTERLSALDLMRTRYDDAAQPAMTALVQRHMDDLNERINADEALTQRYGQILEHSDELDKINLSRWSIARAEQRTEAQNTYRAGAALHGGAARELKFTPGAPAAFKASALRDATPMDGGFIKSRLYGVGDFFSMPVTVVRSLKEMRPNGYMRIDDIDQSSIAELRGQLARIPGIKAETRQNILNQYLKTATEGERLKLLNDLGRLGAAKVAEKHGLDGQAGLDIYQQVLARKQGEVDNLKRYSAATKPGPEGTTLRVDEFADDGGKLVVHPNLQTRLANDHVFQDLDQLDKVLARHTSAFRAIRESRLGNPDWVMDGMDYMTHLFKFATLFRLGYIPRVLSDDVAGQWARAGTAAMAMRIGWGVRNGATNAARAAMRPFNAADEAVALEGVKYAEQEMKLLDAQMKPLRAYNEGMRASNARDLELAQQRVDYARQVMRDLSTTASPAQTGAAQKLFDKRILQLQQAQTRAAGPGSVGKAARVKELQDQHEYLMLFKSLSSRKAEEAAVKQKKVIQGSGPVRIKGERFPGAFEGPEGEMYQTLISPDESLGQIFQTNKQLVHGNLQRSFSHGGKIIRAADDEALHAESWANAINTQLVQDPLAKMAIQNATPEEMSTWLQRTAAGRAYRRRVGLKFTSADELANSAWHDVADYLPLPEIRQAALEGTLTPGFLKEAVPNMAHRPEVHTGQVGLQGQLRYRRALDRAVQSWFNVAANIPAKRMSRHPLFNQLYEGHLKTLAKQRDKQGGWKLSDMEQMTTAARRLALRDTRKLVFDIAHKSDAAAAMRFISPFFAATTESFQRWGRIIADKPQVVGYAYNFYNAPATMGGTGIPGVVRLNGMQDADGNDIMPDGTVMVYDAATGKYKKKLVPKADRYIVGRLPQWLVDSPVGVALGVERSSGNFMLSQNSMNLVTQGDPWYNPGVGPVVQIPVNELVKDKPSQAELARHLGILPFGPQQGTGLFGDTMPGRAVGFMAPSTLKNFLTAFDTSDDRYQRIKLQIAQRAAFEHEELGKPMPSAQKIADMTRNYWLFSAGSAFLQPMATQRKDAYQFYRDQYNALRRQNPLTADDEFLARFGESYFVFAQAQTENATGIQATKKAVALSEKWAPLISKHPELGALIVGPEGNGPFSPEAYSYQLNTPLTPGGSEMQRSKMSADEAMKENQRREGWAKYTAKMNDLHSQLEGRGLKSFEDSGAEDLRTAKQAVTMLYGDPQLPDGSANPFYNEAWSQDFYSFDAKKNDRIVNALTDVAYSDLAKQSQRSDLRRLQEYLAGRKAVLALLSQRDAAGGAKTLGAKANADLATVWGRYVDGLIESDTRFGDLYHRYLSRDLDADAETLGLDDEEVAA